MSGIRDAMSGISQGLGGIGEYILSGLADILASVFVPTYNPIDDIRNTLNTKLPVYSTYMDIYYQLLDEIETEQELKFEMDFNNYYGYSGTVAVIDISWYEPYRDEVKNIISAFLWLTFIWWLIKRMPSVLGGVD